MRTTLEITATVLKLEPATGSLFGKVPLEASGIVTGKLGTAMMVSLSGETWPSSSPVGIGRSWSLELQGEYGRNNRIRMALCAYQTLVAEMIWYAVLCCICTKMSGELKLPDWWQTVTNALPDLARTMINYVSSLQRKRVSFLFPPACQSCRCQMIHQIYPTSIQCIWRIHTSVAHWQTCQSH